MMEAEKAAVTEENTESCDKEIADRLVTKAVFKGWLIGAKKIIDYQSCHFGR